MKLSGPCHISYHLGKECDSWQVNLSYIKNNIITTESYYFQTKENAETYYLYLQQEIARDDLEKSIKSSKTYQWEKRELIDFKKTLDFSVLENKIKDIKFTKEINHCIIRSKK